jgi:hypothetical protein
MLNLKYHDLKTLLYYTAQYVSLFLLRLLLLEQCNTEEPTSCNNNLLIYKISSTCFGQSFAHHQERDTEIFYSVW